MIRNKNINSKLFAPVEGFEPSQTVLETGMLPLHYTDIFIVEVVGIEPTTFRVSDGCSNQLSYIPMFNVTPLGLEPKTPTLKVWCSTN